MKNTLSFMAVTALWFGGAAAAHAQSFSDRIGSTYVQLNAGTSMQDDSSFVVTGLTGEEAYNTEYDKGFVVSGAVGHHFGQFSFIDNVKLELEVGYTSSGVKDLELIGYSPRQGVTGDLNILTFLANMYHEFDTGTRFVPYYGVGLGFADIEVRDFDYLGSGGTVLDGSETAFAYQGSLGVNYIAARNVDVGVRYRYNGSEGLEIISAGGTNSDFDVNNHELTVGIQYRF